MSHIISSNACKKIDTISERVIKQKIVFNFVYFSSVQTLERLPAFHWKFLSAVVPKRQLATLKKSHPPRLFQPPILVIWQLLNPLHIYQRDDSN